jgi:hypothetical protein
LNECTLLTTSTQFPSDELVSSRKRFELNARPYRKRGYFSGSPRRVLRRLKAATIEIALILILVAGFTVAAFCAVDLLDMW